MAIEIRELIIRARVEPQSAPDAGRPVRPPEERSCSGALTADELARILKDKQER